jgi:alkanesulfonate monooxygenase SsuD/methylene tetrahydromethanopterin reductase-like flavin-dependent oxidoreductase (luciferase family)
MWTEQETTYDGKYYKLERANCDPKPLQQPHPPILIGGGGEQLTLRVVARYADVWNFAGGKVEDFTRKAGLLRDYCGEIGRDPSEIALSVQQRVNYDDLPGTVAAVQTFVDAGATHLILNLVYPYPEDIIKRLADEVVPRIRA